MYDERTGFLAAMFFTFFPHTFEFSAGFFSKFWMIPCLLVCMYLLHRHRFRGLILLMPFATVAYPMTSLLIGMICGVYAVMLLFLDREAGRSLFRWLAAGSAIAVLLLSIKYAWPPEFIGPMTPRGELLLHMRDHASPYYPIPSLFEELALWLGHPFIVVSAIGYLLILRRRVHWEHSWTALLLASSIGYVLADLLFIQLYIPNRYTRYSIVVFLALWNATNWARILSGIRFPALRRATLALLILIAGISFRSTFDNSDNMTDSGVNYGQFCGFIRLMRRYAPASARRSGPPRRP